MGKFKRKWVFLVGISSLALMSACATTDYEICDTPDCGDAYNVITE